VSNTDPPDLARLMELARAQAGEPSDWSLATRRAWLERMYAGSEVLVRVWELPTGQLSASAAVHMLAASRLAQPRVVTVTSMLRAGSEELWDEQRAWIDSVLTAGGTEELSDVVVQVVSEALVDADVTRWAASGFALVFEELAMELDLTPELSPRPPWPRGARVVEWSPDAADASFAVYEAAFRDSPRFPGWTQTEWTAWLTGDSDFVPEASLCVLMDGVPAGFVVCSKGWIDQVGVVPARRRLGLASALVTEAAARMGGAGASVARLHVNTNNAGALAAYRALRWHVVGRRGRFERRPAPR
jgi:ribosomal protein S18 acetylase RimI-like enzyme